MRILICNAKSWFDLSEKDFNDHDVKTIKKEGDLSEAFVKEFDPDYIFFVHWHWKVSEAIHVKYTCILFHVAPLPFGRGGTPIQNLILRGFETSPVYALKMTSEIDAGPYYTKTEVSLSGNLAKIFSEISIVINQMMIEIIYNDFVPQSQRGKEYIFKRLTEEDNEIPVNCELSEIYDRVRMLDHDDYPNAFMHYGNLKLEFSNAAFIDDDVVVTCKIKKRKT